ncbi:MAG TPA: hypothetical protein VGG68_05035 [Caulobacteraceae bacterium]
MARTRMLAWIKGLTPLAILVAAFAFASAVKAAVPSKAVKAPAVQAQSIALGPAVVTLDGPWKFRTGDDPSWSYTTTDDSTWGNIDLIAAPVKGRLDPGNPPLTAGWTAKGYKDYVGVAWYRMTVSVNTNAPLAIAGPSSADGPYQLFVNGVLLGGSGDFSPGRPTAHRTLPRLFEVPADARAGASRTLLIAIRTWSPPELVGEAGGGLRAAPAFGLRDDVTALFQQQSGAVFAAHAVDLIEMFAFLILAAAAGTLLAIKPNEAAYRWLISALAATALIHANECLYYLSPVEGIGVHGVLRNVILIPVALALWTLTWRWWLGGKLRRWLSLDLTLILSGGVGLTMAIAMGGLLAFDSDALAHGFFLRSDLALKGALAVFYAVAVAAGLFNNASRANIVAAVAACFGALFLFGDELGFIGLTWDWRPFGAEVSPSQLAEVFFIFTLFATMMLRFIDLVNGMEEDDEVEDLWGEVPAAERVSSTGFSRTPFWRTPIRRVEPARTENGDESTRTAA